MTTFTRLPEDAKPSISVDLARRLSKIDPNIYGGFTEHMGRCIYGGIYDPGNSLSDEHGYRTDVLEALRELDIPVIRYPGGNFVATYHWQDGIGPRENRPARPELAWLGTETNQFGTDEFMQWLELLSKGKEKRVEPYFCLNFGTGTLDEALAWVEYCNGTKNTYYANLRRKNGREEPYDIKYWALGNEMWGPWQVGQLTAEDYSKKASQWAKALKLLDPSLCLILCGETGHASWDFEVLKACIPFIDMHSIHIYTYGTTHVANVVSPLSAERAIQTAVSLIDIARIEAKIPPSVPKTGICFDEWNVWDPIQAPGDQGAEQTYTLSDALGVAVWLNVFVRQSQHVAMANIAQTVNVISPLVTNPNGIIKQAIWYPLYLYSKYMRGWTLGTHVRCGAYDGPTSPPWLQAVLDNGAPWLDVSASVSPDGRLAMGVVNVSDTRDTPVSLEFGGASADAAAPEVSVFQVRGDAVGAVNVEGQEGVSLHESTIRVDERGRVEYTFPKHSFTMLVWSTGQPVHEVRGTREGERMDTRKMVWAE